jgi:hypothetical protein
MSVVLRDDGLEWRISLFVLVDRAGPGISGNTSHDMHFEMLICIFLQGRLT